MKATKLAAFLVVISLMLLAMGSFQTADAAPLKVMQAGNDTYLTDSNGMTLYIFTKDAAGQSTCVGPCVERWPIFYTEKVMVPAGVDEKDFGVITHPSGQKQTTFRGWPLYYWMGDKMAGDMKGQGLNGVWFIVMNPLSK